MAADVSIAPNSSNPCCAELRKMYHKMEKKRNALKEVETLLLRQVNMIEKAKNDLQKALKEEKKRGDSEREAKEKEISVRKTLEKDFEELKNQLEKLEEEKQIVNREKRLVDAEKAKLEEQRKIVERERRNAIEERKRADGLMKELGEERERVKGLQSKIAFVEREKRMVMEEKKRADGLMKELEEERERVKGLQSKIAFVEREKRLAIEEKKRADALMKELEEERERVKGLQSKIASQNATKEKIEIKNLLKKLEEERERVKGLESKIASQNAAKEKIQIKKLLKKLEEEREGNKILQTKLASQDTQMDNLLKKLEEERERNKSLLTNVSSQNNQKGLLKNLEKEKETNKHLNAKIEALTSLESGGILVNNGNIEVKLLKEKLNFRKEKLKHVKNVLKLERSKNTLTKQHLSMLKQDFMQLMNRFKLIDLHLGIEGTNHSTKVKPALESPVEHKSRKSPSVPKSGTSSDSIPTNGQNNYKLFTDKKLQLGPQDRERERERASSVSSPLLKIHKPSGTSLQIPKLSGASLQIQNLSGGSVQNSPDSLKSGRKRKRSNEGHNMDPKKKEKKVKVQNVNKNMRSPDFLEFKKRLRNGGVLKLFEFEDEEMERRLRDAMERPHSPNIPILSPPKIIKENHDCFLARNTVENENLVPKLNIFDLESGSNLSGFNSPTDLTDIVTVDKEKNNCEKSEGVDEKGDILEGQIEKCHVHDYLVVFSSLKEESLERVKSLWKKTNCDESYKASLGSRVLEIASKSELISEERACVIYSLLASSICGKLIQNAKNITDADFDSYIGSFRDDIYAALSEEDLKFLSENKILPNIISLTDDFINHKKVLVYKNGEFCAEAPSKDQFISNCIILASICLKTNRLDINLAFAYKILLEGKTDISHTLLVAHIIIYICGEKLFCTDQERFLSRAVQWAVFKLEKIATSEKLGFLPCEKCPLEMDEKTSEGFLDSLLDEAEMRCLMQNPNPNFVCGESCSVYKAEGNGLCYLMEVISLVELVATYMDWKDVYEKIVSRLFKILELCKNEEYSAALLVLIGHLAKFGVEKLGYEEMQVSELRKKLSNFIKMSEKSAGIALQFTSVGVLLNLIPLQFKEITGDDSSSLSHEGELGSQIGEIRSWFSQLNEEQKMVTQSLFVGF